MAKVRKRYIKIVVQDLLHKYGVVSAPVPIEAIAEREGVGVYVDHGLDPDISGYLYREEGQEPMIVFNGGHHRKRQRFSVAHELGHYLLHRPKSYRVTRDNSLVFRSLVSSAGVVPEEIEANTFAAELLMPEGMLAKAILKYGDDEIGKAVSALADDFQVSPQAMRIRLSVLGYLSPWD